MSVESRAAPARRVDAKAARLSTLNSQLSTFLPQPETCRQAARALIFRAVKLHLENIPPSLAPQRETLARCLEAMNRALPLREVWLFGSHARGDARPDSDVDLCLMAEGAERQLAAAQQFRRAIWEIEDKPDFTLVPIAPQRLAEKKAIDDHFFGTVFQEGILLAAEH